MALFLYLAGYRLMLETVLSRGCYFCRSAQTAVDLIILQTADVALDAVVVLFIHPASGIVVTCLLHWSTFASLISLGMFTVRNWLLADNDLVCNLTCYFFHVERNVGQDEMCSLGKRAEGHLPSRQQELLAEVDELVINSAASKVETFKVIPEQV